MRRMVCGGALVALALTGCAPESLAPDASPTVEQSAVTPSTGTGGTTEPVESLPSTTPTLFPMPSRNDPTVALLVEVQEGMAVINTAQPAQDAYAFVEASCSGPGKVSYKAETPMTEPDSVEGQMWVSGEVDCDQDFLSRNAVNKIKAGQEVQMTVTSHEGATGGWVALRFETPPDAVEADPTEPLDRLPEDPQPTEES